MSDFNATAQIKPRRLAESLVERFAQRMREGTLKRGDKLPTETQIMAAESVSRSVVRDALSRMQAAGLVETQHGVGTFVLDMPAPEGFNVGPATIMLLSDVLDLLEFRLSLEVQAAGMAAERATPQAIDELEQALKALLQGPEKSGSTTNADFQFHLKIAKAAGNPYLIDIMKHLGTKLIPRTRMNSAYTGQSNRSTYLAGINAEHQQIFDAIVSRQVDAARAAMFLHLSNSRMRLREAQKLQAVYSE
ncbi:FadR/GntR family transcriptional regulator [Pseudomonas sp. P1B16]|jgi:DNA-binding FadR family transcriptional regulator|uniref:FadR/GntR family transcriptional regulator n=1 Tax=Pseudomonas TaxID=286 RepID=UPI000513061D|nr:MULTISPECIES: FadR/GntR family transcriptional regulator [unclassified Pseudomonas]KGI92589.1 GntR family transcriptional regulator [Pseudomonas sp. H2]MBC3479603.1 FadR family transcriptional regulator [Pseudomonas sp. SWRI77]MDD1962098.1 FadR family transcriptional regulator [Pseudomonas sp. 39004]MDD2064399.1 FadR family transcriptional regulator [Pseudomonas sp. 25571]UDU83894.1 FadR family transcriptional regulator [Pseudomonas sp. HN2-3]